MNKKFSTLVAALLVSGLGFALVSSFNGLPMSDSPMAKAATANLRAIASEATEATAEAAFTEKVFDKTDAVWNLKDDDPSDGNFYFRIVYGDFYVTKKAKLSKDLKQAELFCFKYEVGDYGIRTVKETDGKAKYLVKTAKGGLEFSETPESALGVFNEKGVAINTFDENANFIISELTTRDETTKKPRPLAPSVSLLTAKLTATANLINGENYYIKNAAGKGLAMQADPSATYKFALSTVSIKSGKLGEEVTLSRNATVEAPIQNALWTAKKIKQNDQAPSYQFTNLVTGKMLAFGLNTTNVIEFNPAGAYNIFEIDGESLIFKVKDVTYSVSVGVKGVNTALEDLTFSVPSEKVVAYPSEDVDAQIKYLNETAGFGNGFGIVFKNMVVDKLKDLAVEPNALSDAPMITAVNASDHLFLKVAGTYPLNDPATRAEQLKSFRESKFIVVDTVRYSSKIGVTLDDNFMEYAIVEGDKLVSVSGEIFDSKVVYDEALFKKGGDLEGVTRRIENAIFTVEKTIGAKVSDPIYVSAKPFIPEANNGEGLAGHVGSALLSYDVAIKHFNGKNYVGAAMSAPRWEYVFIGANNDVDYTKVNGIVNIYSANYKTEGQIFANVKAEYNEKEQGVDYTLGLSDAKDVCANYPEGQFLVNYEKKTGKFTFTNRETEQSLPLVENSYVTVDDEKIYNFSLKAVAGKDNVYAVVGGTDTIKIVSSNVVDKYDGYQNYDETIKHAISDSVYTLAILQPTIEGLTPFYIKESHATDHKLSMTTEKADMAKFKLVKFEGKSDTIKISDAMYINAKGVEVQDSAVAFLYAIYNADNNEYVDYNEETGKEFFYCNPNSKFNEHKATLRFLLKKKADGAYNLIAMGSQEKDDYNKLVGKVFGASVADKLAYEENTYKITENDLITIKAVDAPQYRKIVAAPFDTIRIYQESLQNVALYAKTADKSIVSGEHFLGMIHKEEATKAQYSFFVDTAFVNRTNNNKYQYLLVLDADTVHGKVAGRIDTVYGKFLVNAVDSITSWGTKPNNPYFWETVATPKLAFVNAAHVGDNLIIKSSMFTGKKALASKDTINLKNGLTNASFAFRIVDQATQAFVIETAGGFIKWLNGTPVVVKDVKEAENFNASKTTNKPTANEDLNTSAVTVIAGNGNVTVLNAAGKTVVISNMLGQTIANTVLTSDNQTIAANGIVVVAVEGEEAVKAIIK